MKTKKILNSKVKKNTILSVFDDIHKNPITLLQKIKAIYKNCKIDYIEIQNANSVYTIKSNKVVKNKVKYTKLTATNDYGFILVFHFLDGTSLQTPLIRVATQEVLEQLIQAIEDEINARELGDSELQHDIDNHTSNKNNPHETSFTNLLNVPNLITRVEQVDNSLSLYYVGVDTPFIYTPNLVGGVAWGNITGLLADQTDLANVLQELRTDVDTHTNNDTIHVTQTDKDNWNGAKTNIDTHVANNDIHVSSTEKSTWNNKQNKLYQHVITLYFTFSSGTYTYIIKTILNNNTVINNTTSLYNALGNTSYKIGINYSNEAGYAPQYAIEITNEYTSCLRFTSSGSHYYSLSNSTSVTISDTVTEL